MIARRSVSLALVWLCAAAGALAWCGAPALGQRMHEFSKSFGSEGSGDGQLMHPGALAVNDETGDVYVIDQGNDRVEIFSATGAYVGQFNGEGSPTGRFSWPYYGNDEQPGEIAVDNSKNPLDPSAGDVYVVDTLHDVTDKFGASGVYLGQVQGRFKETADGHRGVGGVAVDSDGDLWVQGPENSPVMDEYNDALMNEFKSEIAMAQGIQNKSHPYPGRIGVAFTTNGDFYIGQTEGKALFVEKASLAVGEFGSSGSFVSEEVQRNELASGIAVDESSNDAYIDNETSVAAYTPSGGYVERFGAGELHASEGIAVNSSTGAVYASDVSDQEVDVFSAFIVPDVTTGSVSHAGETSVVVEGVVNPDGLPVTSCLFEYGPTVAYGESEPCSTTPVGDDAVAVSAELTGLEHLKEYHFRLRASNANGSDFGVDRRFLTPVPVTVGEEGVSDVSSGSALFGAVVNPGGSDTTFRFEYGPSVAYGQSLPMPEGNLGGGTGVEPVSVRPEDLQPGTTYHVRIVATGALGTVYGPDQTFTTQSSGGGFSLLDDRMWEMVSPPDKYGSGIEALTSTGYGIAEAAEDGSAVSYLASGPIVASAEGNPSPDRPTQVLSRRVAGGLWSSEDVVSPSITDITEGINETETEFLSFSSDLSFALVEPPGDTPLSSEATERTIYVRDDATGGYVPVVVAGNVPAGTQFGGRLTGIAATPDLSHVLLVSPLALTSNAVAGEENLYEWAAGRLSLVSEPPEGVPTFESSLGGGHDARHALSDDGSRVFWNNLNGAIYMRETLAGRTVQVDAPEAGVPTPPAFKSQFQTASVDGAEVFFLSEQPLTKDSRLPTVPRNDLTGVDDLYVYDIEAKTLTDLTADRGGSELAGVQNMVLGASEDGSVVYFVATGALASGAEAGQDNLYVESETGATWSAPRLIAVLSPEDGATWGEQTLESRGPASTVSPNGRFLAFMSDRSLTGYDNLDANSGKPDEEVFLYDEENGRLKCVSCDPTGARPTGIYDEVSTGSDTGRLLIDPGHRVWPGHWLAADISPWDVVSPNLGNLVYQPRYLSDRGRLFFNSVDSLVAHDTNGQADVYEYEPEGAGSCEQSAGCVGLISSGTSSEESVFLDAAGTGPGGEEDEDVFFTTASRLTTQDFDTTMDVYDAHVCSSAVPCVTVPALPPPCSTGDSCKAAPSLQPAIFGAPSSATFSGSGNVPSTPATVAVNPKKGKSKSVKHHGKRKRPRKRKATRPRVGGALGKTTAARKGSER
jgi:hypothetical protein